MEHCILYGPPGLGKTTLANIVAKEMDANIITTSGPATVIKALGEGKRAVESIKAYLEGK